MVSPYYCAGALFKGANMIVRRLIGRRSSIRRLKSHRLHRVRSRRAITNSVTGRRPMYEGDIVLKHYRELEFQRLKLNAIAQQGEVAARIEAAKESRVMAMAGRDRRGQKLLRRQAIEAEEARRKAKEEIQRREHRHKEAEEGRLMRMKEKIRRKEAQEKLEESREAQRRQIEDDRRRQHEEALKAERKAEEERKKEAKEKRRAEAARKREEEEQARLRAEAGRKSAEEAKVRAEAARKREEEEGRKREEEAKIRLEAARKREEEQRKREEEERKRAEEETRRAEEERQHLLGLYEVHSRKWDVLKAGVDIDGAPIPSLLFSQIPWPILHPNPSPEDITPQGVVDFIFHPLRPHGRNITPSPKSLIMQEMLKYHPDKFNNIIPSKVSADHLHAVLATSGQIAAILNCMLEQV